MPSGMTHKELTDLITQAVNSAFDTRHCPLSSVPMTAAEAHEIVRLAKASRSAQRIGWSVAVAMLAAFFAAAIGAGVLAAIRGKTLL